MNITILVLSFVSAMFLVLAAGNGLRAVLAESNTVSSRSGGGIERWLYPLCRALGRLHSGPWFESVGQSLQDKLIKAGRPMGGLDGLGFLGLSELAGSGMFAIVVGLEVIAGGVSVGGIVAAAGVGLVGAWLVHAWLDGEITTRRTQLLRDYPYFLDLAVMTMEEGASLAETLEIYCRDNPGQALAEEFQILLKEIQLGRTAADAFSHFNERISADEIKQSINVVIQAQQMDSPMGTIFREQAENMRFKRSQIAERAAEELKIRVMGPVVLMMVAILILILGPAFVGMADSGITS